MSISRSRTNDEHLAPHQRRLAVILLLTAGLARMVGSEAPPEESAESPQKDLGASAPTRPCVRAG
jgi:hypothetical protein